MLEEAPVVVVVDDPEGVTEVEPEEEVDELDDEPVDEPDPASWLAATQ